MTVEVLTGSKSILHVSEPILNGIVASFGTADQLFTEPFRIPRITNTFPRNTFCADQLASLLPEIHPSIEAFLGAADWRSRQVTEIAPGGYGAPRPLVPGGPMATILVLDDAQGVRDLFDTLLRRKGTAP